MRNVLASLLLATAVGLGAGAHAADPPKPASRASALVGHAGMAPGMMGHGGMDMGAMHCMGLSEQRLAAAKTELKITEAQTPQWNAFVEAEKSSAAAMGLGMMQGAGHGAQSGSGRMAGPLPDRLARHEAMMTTHLEALKKVRAAVSPLYEALTPDQKAKADQLLCGGMGGHAQGMPQGRHAHPHHPQ
jgi:hypothetical protein